jgi:acyl-CoA thioesterase
MSKAMTAEDLAKACADAMWAEDGATRGLGMAIEEIGVGRARLAMTVTSSMVNGHGICHGGYIFLLADSAFAFACNTRNKRSVAQHCSISFLRPAKLGDRLVALATERTLAGRSGIYDITVRRQSGGVIAEFRGNSRSIEGELVPGASVTA